MSVLLVEDDESIAIVITAALEAEGLKITRCATIAERDKLIHTEKFSALVSDVILPDGDGITSLDNIRQTFPALPIIILSAQNTLDTAVRASTAGAFEYFPKPFDLDELIRTVRQAVGTAEFNPADYSDEDAGEALPLVGRSAPMQAVYRMITRVLSNDLTVLILGESGTGKELVAEAIHQLGHRKTGPFVAVNTAAIPAELIESELFGHEKGAFTGAVARHIGKFEQAMGGTLFLDEIGDMPMQAQTRLLRALQSGTIRRVGGREEVRIDTRIVAATNKDLQPMIAAGLFREDLYYRINVVPVHLPALRERRDDIESLARHFLQLAVAEGLPRRILREDAVAVLKSLPWRGNVRELRNFMYRLALLARDDVIDATAVESLLQETNADIPETAMGGVSFETAVQNWIIAEGPVSGSVYDSALAAMERPLFAEILKQTGGNQVKASQILGINRNTLRKRLSELALDPDQFASNGLH